MLKVEHPYPRLRRVKACHPSDIREEPRLVFIIQQALDGFESLAQVVRQGVADALIDQADPQHVGHVHAVDVTQRSQLHSQ